MSRAARTPLPADQLPPLAAAQMMITEALPEPAPGPIRDALADDGATRVDRAVTLMETAITGYNTRVAGVIEARMRGPKARKGTRWWSDQVKSAENRGVETTERPIGVEYKALDASYVLPERIVAEITDAVRPVGLRIVADASANVAKSLRRPNTGLAAFDWAAVNQTVDSVVSRMLEVNEHLARDIRKEILAADSTAENLDAAVNRVMEAVRRGGKWLLINGRTLATALAGDAALGAARALGVTHTQWLSRRDTHVRHTHVIADGQERPVGQKFKVGEFGLRFPADPEVLPAGAREVMNCRCSLLFARPAPERTKAAQLAQRGTPAGARRLIEDGFRTQHPMVLGAPELGVAAVPQVRIPADVVGYRELDTQAPITPGQRISWPGPLALALAPTITVGAAVLAVALPVGAAVGVAQGAAILPAGTTLAVVSVMDGQVVAIPESVSAAPVP